MASEYGIDLCNGKMTKTLHNNSVDRKMSLPYISPKNISVID